MTADGSVFILDFNDMDITTKQLRTVFHEAIKAEGLITRADLEASQTEILQAVNAGFQTMEDRFQRFEQRFDRLEKIVDNWPAPSVIKDLLVRVSVLEHKVGIKPHSSRPS